MVADFLTAFDADAAEWVERTGKIFAAGEYPERGLTYTEADLDAAIAAFTDPVPLELEHYDTAAWPSILTGKIGQLVRIWREGTALHGTVRVAAWIDRLWGEADRKVSVAFASATEKRLARCGLVLTPRVPDAALFAAYSAFAGARHSAADVADMQAIHDLAAKQGAACAAPATSPKEARMSFVDTVRAWFDAGMPADYQAPSASVTEAHLAPTPRAQNVVAPDAAFSAAQTALEAEREALKAEKAAFAADRYQAQAEAEVARLITAGHVLPAQNQPNADGQPALVAAFAQALADDARSAVTFSVAGGSRFAALQAAFTSRPAHTLTQEAIPSGSAVLSAGGAQPDAETAAKAERKKMMQQTDLGRKALALVE